MITRKELEKDGFKITNEDGNGNYTMLKTMGEDGNYGISTRTMFYFKEDKALRLQFVMIFHPQKHLTELVINLKSNSSYEGMKKVIGDFFNKNRSIANIK